MARAAQEDTPSQTRRVIVTLILAVFVPGSMQWLVGNRRLGKVALSVWGGTIFLIVVLGIAALVAPGPTVGFLITPAVTSLAIGLVWALFTGWVLLLIDAWRLARPVTLNRAHRLGMTLAVMVLTLSAAAATAFGASAWRAAGNLGETLPGGGDSEAKEGRINVLLLGVDAADDRIGVRPDSINVASIDAETGRTVIFGLPRNMEKVPFPEGSVMATHYPQGFQCEDHSCMLNAVWTEGERLADQFPEGTDAGLQATKDAVTATLGLDLNYYALVDMQGFASIIDAMGGIRMNIGAAIPIGGGTTPISGYIEAGESVHLDGYRALWFARSREGSNDYERMVRQKCVVSAMVNQLDPMTVATRFVELSEAGQSLVRTDVGRGELVDLAQLGLKTKETSVTSVNFSPPLVPSTADPDFVAIRAMVAEAIAEAEAADLSSPSPSPSAPSAASSPMSSSPTPSPAEETTSSEPASADAQAEDAAAICSAG